MSIEKESCGCYVARYQGRETHAETCCAAISKMFGLLADIEAGEVDPLNLPF